MHYDSYLSQSIYSCTAAFPKVKDLNTSSTTASTRIHQQNLSTAIFTCECIFLFN